MTAAGDNVGLNDGLGFFPLTREAFREFAKLHATSDEIGPIATYLDEGVGSAKHDDANAIHKHDDANAIQKTEIVLYGLYGCDALCAAICCLVTSSRLGSNQAEASQGIKLDSIIVDKALRRRGLGAALVARAFADLIEDPARNVQHLYAHSVHPATVRLLRSLAFRDPPPSGAPISSLHFEDGGAAFIKRCRDQVASVSTNLKLQCSYCRANHRKARRWCPKVKFGT